MSNERKRPSWWTSNDEAELYNGYNAGPWVEGARWALARAAEREAAKDVAPPKAYADWAKVELDRRDARIAELESENARLREAVEWLDIPAKAEREAHARAHPNGAWTSVTHWRPVDAEGLPVPCPVVEGGG